MPASKSVTWFYLSVLILSGSPIIGSFDFSARVDFVRIPGVIKLKNGNLLCTYGYRKEPYSIKAIISNDNGLSWNKNDIITIRDNANFWDIGYPVSVELPDGNILTVYYWIDKNSVRYITSNIWKIQ